MHLCIRVVLLLHKILIYFKYLVTVRTHLICPLAYNFRLLLSINKYTDKDVIISNQMGVSILISFHFFYDNLDFKIDIPLFLVGST